MRRSFRRGVFAACLLTCVAVCPTEAATYFSNSLTGLSGDTSLAPTQAALASAGFSVYSTSAAPAVSFGAGGAAFGSATSGDGGRNYLRTADGDYATVDFVAEITFTTSSDSQAVFVGLGSGDTALFGIPDWSTQLASASFWPESGNDKAVVFRTNDDSNKFVDSAIPGFSPGTHRLRMTYAAATGVLGGAIDLNYAGGPFAADVTLASIATLAADPTPLGGATGWPSEPSRIFFGGDDGTVFRDFSVLPEPNSLVLAALGAASLRRRRARWRSSSGAC